MVIISLHIYISIITLTPKYTGREFVQPEARTLIAQGPQISDLISPLKSLDGHVSIYACALRGRMTVCMCLRRKSGVLIIC